MSSQKEEDRAPKIEEEHSATASGIKKEEGSKPSIKKEPPVAESGTRTTRRESKRASKANEKDAAKVKSQQQRSSKGEQEEEEEEEEDDHKNKDQEQNDQEHHPPKIENHEAEENGDDVDNEKKQASKNERKSKKETPSAAAQDAETPEIKKPGKRGRPAGWKKQKDGGEGAASATADSAKKEPKKRGRKKVKRDDDDLQKSDKKNKKKKGGDDDDEEDEEDIDIEDDEEDGEEGEEVDPDEEDDEKIVEEKPIVVKSAPRPSKRLTGEIRDLHKKELAREDWPTSEQLETELSDLVKEIQASTHAQFTREELERIYQLMDLTNLNTTDGYDTVEEWVKKNCLDVAKDHPALKPAAICVYPLFAHIVRTELRKSGIKTAAVSTSFPTGLTFLDIKISETKEAVREGAEEIDMVVNRGVWNEGEELDVLEEVSQVKKACGVLANLKVILETCDLKDYASIYKLAYLTLCAGGDFIKTSTGKGRHGAKLDHFAIMCKALKDFNKIRNEEVRGIKAAGSVQDAQTAWRFITIFERITGKSAKPEIFRIGASSLAKNIVEELKRLQ